MAISGNEFRNMVIKYIKSWNTPLQVLYEVNVGSRFVKTPRKVDIVILNPDNNKTMAIECKSQQSDGSAYEKLSYALEDCLASPIPTILVLTGGAIKQDMKSKIIMSGHGIWVDIDETNKKIIDKNNLLRQRCYIELGMNWFPIATGDNMNKQLRNLGYNIP